jgi:hypothetical protein
MSDANVLRASISILAAFLVIQVMPGLGEGAALVQPATKLNLPYSGNASGGAFTFSSGCGGNSLNVFPKFNLSTGNGVVGAKSTTVICANGSVGYHENVFGVSVLLDLPPLSGSHLVNETVTFHLAVNLSLANGTCTPTNLSGWWCHHVSGVQGVVASSLVDVTKKNLTRLKGEVSFGFFLGNFSNSTSTVNYGLTGNSFSTAFSSSAVIRFHPQFVAGHQYKLLFDFQFLTTTAYESQGAVWSGSCSASASVHPLLGHSAFNVKPVVIG